MDSPIAPQRQSNRADEEAIRGRYAEFDAAFRKGDLQGMLASMSNRAVFAWDQIEIVGREALEQAFAENLAAAWKDADVTHNINGIEFLTPSVATAWGSYLVVLSDGSRHTGHIMNSFVKQNGRWFFASEQTSSAG